MRLTDDHQQSFGPSRNVICAAFGVKTWAEVIEAAGLGEMVVKRKKPYGAVKRELWSAEDVIAAYREIICTEGILPGQRENVNLYRLRTKFFASEEEVVTAAGYNYKFLRKITDRVRRMRREGLPSAGYYEATISVYPHLAKYDREYVEKHVGMHPVKGQIYERMGESGAETISPAEHWKLWQEYYKKELFRPPGEGEPHEMLFAQIIMVSTSPSDAIMRLIRSAEKYPSSVGADPVEEFKRLWVTTRTEVLPEKRRLVHPGYIQIERQRRAG
jgi:hypothetical protein